MRKQVQRLAHTLWSVPFNKDAAADQWGSVSSRNAFGMMILNVHTHSNALKCLAHAVQRSTSALSTAHLRVRAGAWKTPDRRSQCDLAFGNAFLVMSPKSPAMKKEI